MLSGADERAKWLLDRAVACCGLLVLAPVFLAIALAVRVESRGPVFYRCRRVGARGRVFFMLKFRKMRDGASGLPLTAIDDERFTRMGAFLARTKIDELPQLWNVLKADMSIVGPRPEDPAFVDLDPATFADVLSVKPGITGLSQLAFARESEILDPSDRVRNYVARLLPAKVGLDRLYAAHRSVGMDARILAWTLYAVILRRDVAVHRGSGRITTRRRTSVEQPQAAPSMASHSG